MTDNRDDARIKKIKNRIRALLMKTVENGATEGEAVSAAEKAAELMAEYDIEFGDIKTAQTDAPTEKHASFDPELDDSLWKIASAISKLCHCKVWAHVGIPGKLTFLGDDIDSSIAAYLMTVCERAVRTETKKATLGFALYRRNIRHRKRLGFIAGMTERLAVRIRELAWQRERAAKTGLVPSKMAKIDDWIKAKDIQFSHSGVHGTITDPVAEAMGKARANEVPLNRGLGENGSPENLSTPILSIADR